MSSVLVTGASGFLGSRVVERLTAEDAAGRPAYSAMSFSGVVALDVREDPRLGKMAGVVPVTRDIRDPELSEVFTTHGVDTVVHLAAVVTPGRDSDRALEYSIDVGGTRNVVDACVRSGVRQLVYTSSGAAYGYHADNPTPLREHHDLRANPEFAYSHHKRIVEEMLAAARSEHPELAQLVFRPGTILGEGVDNQITAIFDRPVVTGVRGSDSPFVFVWDEDVAEAVLRGIRERRQGIYNLCGDGSVTLREIARRLHKPYVSIPPSLLAAALRTAGALGLTAPGPEQVRFLAHRPVLANDALKEEFGFVPSLTSSECFDAFVAARRGRASTSRALRVVVTGGASGIGAALVRRYCDAGSRVAILDKDDADAPPDGLALRCDVTDPGACDAAISRVVDTFGGIDLLVNNAGLTQLGRVGDTDTAVYRKVMDVNFFGAVNCTKAALPHLLGSRGGVIVVSSVAGFAPLHGRSGYCASKHALHGFFDTLRSEYSAEGLAVTVVCPSFVDTAIGEHALGVHGESSGADERTGVRHPMDPDEVAAQVVEAGHARRRLVLVSREARLSWWLSRFAPRAFEALMLRRARR